jgi:putative ABC transport system permease protein
MYAIAQNVRFAFRQLRKTPGFSVTVILMLALGIGATTAIFSLVEGILLRPLPFRDPDRLVVLGDHLGGGAGIGLTGHEIPIYSSATNAFSSLGGYATAGFELSGGAQPEEIPAGRLNASTFSTLGIQPMLGRLFTTQEDKAHQPLAVLSYALWVTRYHRDPQVLGRAIVLDRRPYSIIGVMPRSFEFPLQTGELTQVQVWVPLSLTPDELEETAGCWCFSMVGRVKEGVSLPQAAQDVDRVARQIMRNFPVSMSALHIQGDAKPLRENVVADVRPVLGTLFLAVAVVLLIACVNVAGLLLVRSIRRQREYAVRLALGAQSSVILRESVFEGLLLSVAGGVVGLALAAFAIRTALHLLPDTMPRVHSIAINGTVVLFALLLALATGIFCSLAPAFSALRTDLTESLKDGAKAATASASHTWLRSTLVVSEIAIALVLLTTSGVLLRSFEKMHAVDPGYRSDHLLVAGYQLPLNQYPTYASVDAFNRSVVDRLSGKPGVVAAGTSNSLPAVGPLPESAYTIEGVSAANWKLKFAAFAITDGDYFRALGIPLLEGRSFTRDDSAHKPAVVIVNQSMARHSWPGQSAIGKRMHAGNPRKVQMPWATVIGVVADINLGARDEPVIDQWYAPAQQPATLSGSDYAEKLGASAGGYIALRSALPPEQMINVLRSTVGQIDPLLPLEQIQPMSQAVSDVEAPRRFNTDLITSFALGALLLAVTGIYAVVAFSVSLRAQEIAIRMALGAQRAGIARLVLVAGVKLAMIGCGLGVIGSLAVSRLLRSFLFDVSATDPFVYAAAALTMMLMALLASALPALRAASADPIAALRSS